MNLSDPKLRTYAARLYDRRHEAKILAWGNITIGSWKPREHDCHQNVTDICTKSPDYEPVRGWVYFDTSVLGFVKFVAHSAVLAPTGVVFDVTPSRASQQYPFLAAEEPEDEFAALVESGVTELLHYL